MMRSCLTLSLLVGMSTMALAQTNAGPPAASPAQTPTNRPNSPTKTPRDESAYVSEDQLRDIIKSAPGSFSTRVFSDTTYSVAFIRLEKPDQPHAHGAFSELFVVQEGNGVVETNGTITGVTGHNSAIHQGIFVNADGTQRQPPTTPTPPPSSERALARNGSQGDLAGTAIEGGHRQAVKPGDLILIPAGTPHHWVQIDTPVVYLDIKFPKAE